MINLHAARLIKREIFAFFMLRHCAISFDWVTTGNGPIGKDTTAMWIKQFRIHRSLWANVFDVVL